MGTLVNMPTYTGETALHILGRMASPRGSSYSRGEGEEELRRKMFMTLVDCGADITLCDSPDPLDAQFTILGRKKFETKNVIVLSICHFLSFSSFRPFIVAVNRFRSYTLKIEYKRG